MLCCVCRFANCNQSINQTDRWWSSSSGSGTKDTTKHCAISWHTILLSFGKYPILATPFYSFPGTYIADTIRLRCLSYLGSTYYIILVSSRRRRGRKNRATTNHRRTPRANYATTKLSSSKGYCDYIYFPSNFYQTTVTRRIYVLHVYEELPRFIGSVRTEDGRDRASERLATL